MSQVQGEHRDIAFDGRILLDGDNAPELEVLVELNDEYLILGHSSGELGRWEKHAVRVAPIGRGWFTIDVEDEQVSFLPRRPGYFAAATIDMVPVEGKKKRRSERRAEKKEAARVAKEKRRELKRQRRRQAEATAGPSLAPAEPAPLDTPAEPRAAPVPPAEKVPAERPAPAEEPPPVAAAPAAPVEEPAAPVEPGPWEEPASPWDDLPVPEIPGRTPRSRRSARAPAQVPRKEREKTPRPPRQRTPRPAREKTPKPPREKTVEPARPARPKRTAEPSAKSGFDKASAAFWHGFKGVALRISDELRQTGIVPFDRLPAAPARSRPAEDHTHRFEEHRLPGGLIRNVCHECGLVSIGDSGGMD